MQPSPVTKHITDIVKGAIGAVIAGALVGLLQYFGLHVPLVVTPFVAIAGGFFGVKLG